MPDVRPLPISRTALSAVGLLLALAVGLPAAAPAQTPAATVEDGSGNVVLRSYTGRGLLAPDQGAASGDIPTEGAGTRPM